MSIEFPKYLKRCKKYDFNKLVAVIDIFNIPSMRIVKKNNFIKFKEDRTSKYYMIDLNYNIKQLDKLTNIINNYYEDN